MFSIKKLHRCCYRKTSGVPRKVKCFWDHIKIVSWRHKIFKLALLAFFQWYLSFLMAFEILKPSLKDFSHLVLKSASYKNGSNTIVFKILLLENNGKSKMAIYKCAWQKKISWKKPYMKRSLSLYYMNPSILMPRLFLRVLNGYALF